MKMTVFVIETISAPKKSLEMIMKLVCANLGFISYNMIKLYEADFWSLKMSAVPQGMEHHVSYVYIFCSLQALCSAIAGFWMPLQNFNSPNFRHNLFFVEMSDLF